MTFNAHAYRGMSDTELLDTALQFGVDAALGGEAVRRLALRTPKHRDRPHNFDPVVLTHSTGAQHP